jgi:hypothetical protein
MRAQDAAVSSGERTGCCRAAGAIEGDETEGRGIVGIDMPGDGKVGIWIVGMSSEALGTLSSTLPNILTAMPTACTAAAAPSTAAPTSISPPPPPPPPPPPQGVTVHPLPRLRPLLNVQALASGEAVSKSRITVVAICENLRISIRPLIAADIFKVRA